MVYSKKTVTSVSMNMNINNNPTFSYVGLAGNKPAQSFGNATSVLRKGAIENKKISTVLKKFSEFSSPEQRLILGVTALFTQPFIDLNNKRVNEETRLMAFSRTLAKIIIGTTVGVIVRKECIKHAKNYTEMIVTDKVDGIGKEACAALKNSFLSPKFVRTYNTIYRDNYVNAIGTFMGIGVSLITNFLIDAPLTQIFTNKLYKYLKDKGDEKYKKPENTNILTKKLAENTYKKNQISFSGSPIKELTKPKKAKSLFDKIKEEIWKNVANKPGDTLMHTGAIGWAASSLAQITGMIFNDSIDSNKKKFLIPQEFADAVGNITLYYIVTMGTKRIVEGLFEKGKIKFVSVIKQIEDDHKKGLIKCELEDIFNGKSVLSQLGDAIESKRKYLAHKNGASVLATLIASVISCNILTPYFRNIYGAYCYDKAKDRLEKLNTKLFDMQCDDVNNKFTKEKSKSFENFLI